MLEAFGTAGRLNLGKPGAISGALLWVVVHETGAFLWLPWGLMSASLFFHPTLRVRQPSGEDGFRFLVRLRIDANKHSEVV